MNAARLAVYIARKTTANRGYLGFALDANASTANVDADWAGNTKMVVNYDGNVDVVDIVMIVHMILGVSEVDLNADYNQDSLVNVIDIIETTMISATNKQELKMRTIC